jgi:hypothetical protein
MTGRHFSELDVTVTLSGEECLAVLCRLNGFLGRTDPQALGRAFVKLQLAASCASLQRSASPQHEGGEQ